MLTVYGIPNCNTVKRARAWLEAAGIAYDFHDYKKQGTDAELLKRWIEKFGWEKVVNRAGMTWRRLSDEEKAAITDPAAAIKLMQEKPSVIKRPIVQDGEQVVLGFSESDYRQTFSAAA